MRPRVTFPGGEALVTVVLVPEKAEEAAAAFQHIVKRTQDPRERHAMALKMLAAEFYQDPDQFSDTLTALFDRDSQTAAGLLKASRCVLTFEQSQAYRIPCAVAELAEGVGSWQATYWHNAMFNDTMPGAVRIHAFVPDWARAEVDPAEG